jgi:RNA polymerase sigma factor (sigma-70 family)
MTKPDKTLVRECIQGKREAWETLTRRYSRLIYSIALRCGLNEDDAADVFQSVCVKLLANLERLNDDQHLTGWLITTARHECASVLRQRNRIQQAAPSPIEGESKLSLLPADDPLPVDTLVQIEEENLVRQAVEDMGGRCRELIELLYLSDPPATYGDAAQRLRMPVGSVGPTRARCLKTLKESLLKRGF